MLCVISMLLMSSCSLFYRERYACEAENVESIQIIRLDTCVREEYRWEYTILSEISDIETFVNRLNKIEHSVNRGSPTVFCEGDIVIRINYKNGARDELCWLAQQFYPSDGNNWGSGYIFFNKEQFEALLADYLAE